MDMEQMRKESLITMVRLYSKRWRNQQLYDLVYQAIEADDMTALMNIIDTLVMKVNEQREVLSRQTTMIKVLQETIKEVDAILNDHQQSNGRLIEPPAKKKTLKTQEMYILYQQYNSFNKVGELLGCAGKTVSRRLRAEGYID